MNIRTLGRIWQRTVVDWFDHGASSTGAAIAFYTLFSIAPILFFVIWVAGAFFAPEAVQSRVMTQMKLLLGEPGAEAVKSLLASTHYGGKTAWSTAVGLITLLIGSTSVFGELQNALNRIWETAHEQGRRGMWIALRDRLLSFGLVLGVGFLLLVSLIISAGLEGVGSWLGSVISDWHRVLSVVDVLLGFCVTSVLFAMIFKFIPREVIAWGDVWVGALATAGLFALGKMVIVVYLGRAAFSSAYGVAGAFLILMLWVYYSAQIFLLGAEFTHAYAYQGGSRRQRSQARSTSSD